VIENIHVVMDTSILILYDKMMTTVYFSLDNASEFIQLVALLIKNSIQMPIALKHQKANGIK